MLLNAGQQALVAQVPVAEIPAEHRCGNRLAVDVVVLLERPPAERLRQQQADDSSQGHEHHEKSDDGFQNVEDQAHGLHYQALRLGAEPD